MSSVWIGTSSLVWSSCFYQLLLTHGCPKIMQQKLWDHSTYFDSYLPGDIKQQWMRERERQSEQLPEITTQTLWSSFCLLMKALMQK